MRNARGQTMVLLALTMVLVVVMAAMTLSISNRVRRRLELQTVADTAAYNNAISTARGFNAMGVLNRTIVSHWVVMLGIESNIAWASTVPAYFDAFAETLNDMRPYNQCCGGAVPCAAEDRRQQELTEARDAFNHASLSLWNGPGAGGDDVKLMGCPKGNCFPRLKPGLGQLDKAAADQSKEVWRSVRDLVEVQRDIHKELETVLGSQTLARQATLAALGRPLDAADTFPYRVHKGAQAWESVGVPGRAPGWREVSSALGTTREAMTPLAHAAMGSRGSRFVINNMYESNNQYFPFTPRRAKRYTQRIEKVMNARYAGGGRTPFRFQIRAKQSATFLDDGREKDLPADADIDEAFESIEEADNTLIEDESGAEATESPAQYDPNIKRRITPDRSIGMEYATSLRNGLIEIRYNSPCGYQSKKRGITAAARSHTRMALPAVSQHEWQQMLRSTVMGADGSKEYEIVPKGVLHGDKQGDHGYERNNHGPSGQCHPGHRHWGEEADRIHALGNEIDGLGISPGGFGYVFPQDGRDPVTGLDRDGAAGAFGQPRLPVLITRANSGGGLVPDPWNLTFRFSFKPGAPGTRLDLGKESSPMPITALATGMAYYHRRCDGFQPAAPLYPNGTPAHCTSWQEAPNLLNPFWRATLVPIDIDEALGGPDRTPGNRLIDEAPTMLEATVGVDLSDAAQTYRLLKGYGYRGIQ